MGDILDRNKAENVNEIFQGMTVEEMKAMFFDKALIEPPYKVFQLNSKGHRYYYRFDDFGNPEFYPSVTTIISQTMPKSAFLEKWIIDKGFDEAERIKMERASYGTFMHAQFEKLLIEGTYNLDNLRLSLLEFMEINKLPSDFVYYADDLKKDVLAFAQFVIDYDVKPLAVEISLVHPFWRYAGMIDLPCTMRIKPNDTERITAIVDFKSGRKGFFEEHELQLHLYKALWNVNFEQYPINRVYNFSPKDWRKAPSYNLKDQTDSKMQGIIDSVLNIAAMRDEQRSDNFCCTSGVIDLRGGNRNLSGNIINLSLSELIKSKAKNDKPSENSGIDLTAEIKPQAAKEPTTAVETKKSGKQATDQKDERKTSELLFNDILDI